MFHQILKNKPSIRAAVLSTEKEVKWLVPGHPATPGLGQGLPEAQVPLFHYPKVAFFDGKALGEPSPVATGSDAVGDVGALGVRPSYPPLLTPHLLVVPGCPGDGDDGSSRPHSCKAGLDGPVDPGPGRVSGARPLPTLLSYLFSLCK